MYKRKARVLFLSAGNACRSQMAEGFANNLGKDWIEAQSAGIDAHGMNPQTITIMTEDGIDISEQKSKVVTEEMLRWADLIVTVCHHADEQCPPVPAYAQKKHWHLPDPSKATGTEEEINLQYRAVREEIKRRISSMLGGMKMVGNH